MSDHHVADLDRPVYCLLGLPFDAINLTDAVDLVSYRAVQADRLFVSTPNLNFLVAARADESFRLSVIASDLSLADGMPIVWVARLLGIPIRQRVAGSDLIRSLMAGNPARPLRVYFFGGEAQAAERAAANMNAQPGGMMAVGSCYPGFGSLDDMSEPAMINAINAAQPDVLVVALGAKKGQAWILRNLRGLNAPVVSHLGAVINFFAGTVKRAPVWMQRCGLEWLWRIAEEPELWRRYCHDGVIFLLLLATRVAPYAVWLKLPGKTKEPPAAGVIVEARGDGIQVLLSGAMDGRTLATVRNAIKQALQGEARALPWFIDLERVTEADPAFIGFLFLLKKALLPATMSVCHARPKLARIFYWNGAEFLLEENLNKRSRAVDG